MTASLSDDELRKHLNALAAREIPERFDASQHDWNTFDAGGSRHRYELRKPLSEAEVASFEKEWKVTLPGEYRSFLLNLGNGGAGPGYGLFALGKEDGRPIEEEVLEGLATPFDEGEALEWEGDGELSQSMRGAVPIATDGCDEYYWLVVTGQDSGQMWRSDVGTLDPIIVSGQPLQFRDWYEQWLRRCAERYL